MTTGEQSGLQKCRENKRGNVSDEYEDLSLSSHTNSIYNVQEKESEAMIHGKEIELLADTNNDKEMS